jgi:3',5'-cyclic AMP phosphodiesterase CpdA
MLTFLHLSDLHFTTTDADTQFDRDVKIREALLADLGKDGRSKFDAILVTGDIAYHGRVEEFS